MKKVILILSVLLTSCVPTENETKSAAEIALTNLFEADSNSYLVYFYSDHCRHCLNIKEDILSFYNDYQGDFFFLNTDENNVIYKTGKEELIGVDNLEDFYIVGTPSLIRFEYHIVSEYYLGEQEIIEYITGAK